MRHGHRDQLLHFGGEGAVLEHTLAEGAERVVSLWGELVAQFHHLAGCLGV
jgi:hypothetical protein